MPKSRGQPASRIHAGLTRKRELVGTAYLGDPGLRAEYEAEIAPRTRAALARVLSGLGERLVGVRRVLDLGAGTGAAGAAVIDHLQALGPRAGALELVSVDKVAAARGVIVADLRRDVRPRGVQGHFDLIVAGHLLNEFAATMSVAERAALVFAWGRELLADGGLLVLLEPALRTTGRDLLAIRDRLIEGGFFVLAPCYWQGPCPALLRERDWCHDSAAWPDGAPGQRPGRSRVDFAHLVLARGGERSTDKRIFRVVSDPMEEKGRLRLYGCGPAGRHALIRLDREASDDNAAFAEAARGETLVIDRTEVAGDGLRVTSASRVARRF